MIKKLILTVLVLLVCYDSVQLGRQLTPKLKVPAIDAKYLARSQGNPKAPLWIIEYLDFECESCRDSLKMMRYYLERHPKEIYWQIRYYPLIHNHRYALKSAIYAECASQQKKFREFSDWLFETQAGWSQSEDPDALFLKTAAEKGLSVETLKACVESPAAKELVLGERQEGKSLGLRMTPTFFVNGVKIEGVPAMSLEFEKMFPPKKEKKGAA